MKEVVAAHKKSAFEQLLETALQIPGVKVNRNAFLAQVFSKFPTDVYTKILETDPVTAGCSQADLHKLAIAVIDKRTLQSTGASFAAGLPGGIAMAATIPADTLQFFGMALRLAQEIGYIYGASDMYSDGKLDDEKVQGQLILYLGAMFGVSGSVAAVKVISSAIAQQVLKTVPTKTFGHAAWYLSLKKIVKVVGIKLTRPLFAKGLSKAIPVVGGIVSGGLTFASMRPMGKRLQGALEDAHFNYTHDEVVRDIEILLTQQESDDISDAEAVVEAPEELIWSPVSDSVTTELSEEPAQEHGQVSTADELLKYKQLLDIGVLTAEEFGEIKAKLLVALQ